MRWQGRRGSSNIEDRRGRSGSVGRAGGVGGLGLVAIVVVGWFLGIDVTPLLQGVAQQSPGGSGGTAELTEADQQAAQFVSVTLADTEEVWTDIFRTQLGEVYDPAVLVLFSGVTQSPCGARRGRRARSIVPPIRRRIWTPISS